MLETLIMLAGVLAGCLFLKCGARIRKLVSSVNSRLQLVCVALIIFIMGVNLGTMDDFAAKIISMGGRSLVFAIVPTAFSVALVYALSRRFIIREKK